ncbi:MAG: hypothetical protein R3B51_05840 [Thermodesulfobacteriota bacterium]
MDLSAKYLGGSVSGTAGLDVSDRKSVISGTINGAISTSLKSLKA